jgi:cold shock CspA family protein
MGRSSETFNKREKEKKRLKKAQDKAEKMEERKANAKKGKSLEDMIAYIDENGNFTSTPPDPSKRKEINLEDIQLGVSRPQEEEEEGPRNGQVTFFNSAKGFGFIKDSQSGESFFVHVNELTEQISEGDKVLFERGSSHKGPVALSVKKA